MAAGDMKGPCKVIKVTSGAAVAVGQVVHIGADGYWGPAADADVGKFGVALDAASGSGEEIRIVIEGPVEVTATAAAIAKGAHVMAGAGGLVAEADHAAAYDIVGTALDAFASGGTATVHVGMM